MLKGKSLVTLIIITSFTFKSKCQPSKFSYFVTDKCDSVTGYFYFCFNSNQNSKSGFHDVTTRGGFCEAFFRNEGKEIPFNPDTAYTVIDSFSHFFTSILDSLKINYKIYSEFSYSLMDSLSEKYKRNKIKLKNQKAVHSNRKRAALFVRVKMKVYYNNSYIQENYIPQKIHFTENGKIRTKLGPIDPKNEILFYKPILSFQIIK